MGKSQSFQQRLRRKRKFKKFSFLVGKFGFQQEFRPIAKRNWHGWTILRVSDMEKEDFKECIKSSERAI